MKHELDDLASPSDLAKFFGVSPPAISNWISRYENFPRPLVHVANGRTPLYSRTAVVKWYAESRMSQELLAALRD